MAKILIDLEANERGEPIEIANAIINMVMDKTCYTFEANKNALAEITEHIEVYLKHCEVKGGAE